MVKQVLIVTFAIIVIAVTAFNVSTVLDSNRSYDLNMTTIAAISGEDGGNTDSEGGVDGEGGDVSGEGGSSDGILSYCHSGGRGSESCSIDAGVEIKGVGVSAGCSVSCKEGYYACCSLRCKCDREV